MTELKVEENEKLDEMDKPEDDAGDGDDERR
jgi:hypothetical protein